MQKYFSLSLSLVEPDLLVVLTLVLGDVELCVQVIEQCVRTLLTQRVVDVTLTRHDVEEIARYLRGKERAALLAYVALLTTLFNAQSTWIFSTFNLWLRFSIVPPSEASPISVKLLALSVDITLQGSANLSSLTRSLSHKVAIKSNSW